MKPVEGFDGVLSLTQIQQIVMAGMGLALVLLVTMGWCGVRCFRRRRRAAL